MPRVSLNGGRLRPADVNRLEAGHDTETADCAIIAIGVYLGVPYTDIIRIAARVVEDGGRNGLSRPALLQIARMCQAPLRVRRTFDPDESYGIVWSEPRKAARAHCAVLKWGQVLDRRDVWPWDAWLLDQKSSVRECVLLEVVGV